MRGRFVLFALTGCGPAFLGDEIDVRAFDAAVAQRDATPPPRDTAPASREPMDAGEPIEVAILLQPPDCSGCYELFAAAVGGEPPFAIEWDDGSRGANRRVCVNGGSVDIWVTAQDARSTRSNRSAMRLLAPDASCPPPPAELCLDNRSFEGRPLPNLGLPTTFDAAPWSTCTNPAAANTPDIANETLMQALPMQVVATDGLTYASLAEDEQVSQVLCRNVAAGETLHLQLDLNRLDVTGGAPPERIALEVWGGVGADCSRRELLWASPALGMGWQNFCATLKPAHFTDNLVLRATSDKSQAAITYVLVDHLVPVDRCP